MIRSFKGFCDQYENFSEGQNNGKAVLLVFKNCFSYNAEKILTVLIETCCSIPYDWLAFVKIPGESPVSRKHNIKRINRKTLETFKNRRFFLTKEGASFICGIFCRTFEKVFYLTFCICVVQYNYEWLTSSLNTEFWIVIGSRYEWRNSRKGFSMTW